MAGSTMRIQKLCYLLCLAVLSTAQEVEILSNTLDYVDVFGNIITGDLYFTENKTHHIREEVVEVKVYYESLCPDCRQFFTQQLQPVYRRLEPYLNLTTYPYGNAETTEKDGKYIFECQHGPTECYGNKLHACAMLLLSSNSSLPLFFAACLMEEDQQGRGSDDRAADVCGASLDIDVEPIKTCARSDRGDQLLKYYGDESKKVGFEYVPYILINGKVSDGTNFLQDVCRAFTIPPQQCSSN